MSHHTNTSAEAEKVHQAALKLIYRHTHKDYKGVRAGVKEILTVRGLIELNDLSEFEIAARLPQALKKEAQRIAKREKERAQ